MKKVNPFVIKDLFIAMEIAVSKPEIESFSEKFLMDAITEAQGESKLKIPNAASLPKAISHCLKLKIIFQRDITDQVPHFKLTPGGVGLYNYFQSDKQEVIDYINRKEMCSMEEFMEQLSSTETQPM